MLRDFSDVQYIPILSLRPAEMNALQELPSQVKDALLPYVLLRPWLSARNLSNVVGRLEQAYARRPVIVDLCETDTFEGDRPVHTELTALRNPLAGYIAWYNFIASHNNFIPALQLEEPTQLRQQASLLASLGRGVVLRVRERTFNNLVGLLNVVSPEIEEGGLLVVIDFEQKGRDILGMAVQALGFIQIINQHAPSAHISVAATSFPDSFAGVQRQEIFERVFFNQVAAATDRRIIYSDRGSARAERVGGGGGLPAPRIDLPLSAEWRFFRSDAADDRDAAYEDCAIRVMSAAGWDPSLRLWGVQMIERTAIGDPSGITSPARSTAARINIHLHRQLFHDAANNVLRDTDEDWTD